MAKDTCVLCGIETSYDVETHIDFRTGYVEGAGQLCYKCYKNGADTDIYVPKEIIKETPNDQELGGKVRSLYYKKTI
jgi:hypothetical protein